MARYIIALLVAIALPASAQTTFTAPLPLASASAISPAWGCLPELVDLYWIETSSRPILYQQYSWYVPNVMLAYNGMDSDGVPISGQFILDPGTGQLSVTHVRKGQVATYAVVTAASGFTLTGSDSGVEVRQTYSKKGFGAYGLQLEERRNGKWVTVRTLDFVMASPPMIKALGWVERNPNFEAEAEAARKAALAARPSFVTRLGNAVEDGVATGIGDGVHDKIRSSIAGKTPY